MTYFLLYPLKGSCPNNTIGTLEAYGVFKWPETPVGNIYKLPCPYNNESVAKRECLYTNQTNSGSIWDRIMATDCRFRDGRSKDLFLLMQVNRILQNSVVYVANLRMNFMLI